MTALATARIQIEAAEVPAVLEPVRAEMLDFVDRHPDALLRTCAEGHLTGSALVVDEGSGRMALLLHRKLGLWLQPGGHADGEGDLAAVAGREACEETGLEGLAVHRPAVDLDIHLVDPPGEAPHRHLDVRFLAVAPAGSRLRGNHESLDLRWVSRHELVELAPDEGLVRLADAGLARLGRR